MPAVVTKTPVDDGAAVSDVDLQIPKIVELCRTRSERGRRTRSNLNRTNWDLYHGRQDWSHKQKYQSKEFLPDLPMAIEQMTGVIERALTDFSDWFDVQPFRGANDDLIQSLLLDPASMRALLMYLLQRLWIPGDQPDTAYSFPMLISDAVKLGLMEAVITLKVYGVDVEKPHFRLEVVREPDQLALPNGESIVYERARQVVQRVVQKTFRLAIDPIPWEDFFPDPSGMNQFDIHEVTRNVYELRENGDYDPEVIERLIHNTASFAEAQAEKRRRSGQDQTDGEEDYVVRVREFWGDLVDGKTGKKLGDNVLVTTVGDTYLLRPPTPNPYWHGKRPFVKAPLIRVPLSTVHKALVDHAGPMARLMNELMNLMLDGGFAATWGTRQVRPDLMEHPEEIADGVPQGYTAVLKPNVPRDSKFLERVDEGDVPQFAAAMLTRVERSHQTALAMPDLKMANLPPRQVKATEVVEVMQASASLFESISTHLEDGGITPTLELAWMTMWQHLDDFTTAELVQLLGPRRALLLQQMTPEERFVRLASSVRFRVSGLRNIAGRSREYVKFVNLLQTLGINPALAMAFDRKYSVTKLMGRLMKAMDIDPMTLEKDDGAGPELDPMALMAGRGGGGPESQGLERGGIESAMAPTNPEGDRGAQVP